MVFFLGIIGVMADTNLSCVKGTKCFTQSQINCFFLKLSPVITLFLILTFVGIFKYGKKITKLSKNDKIIGIISIIAIFYLISFILVKLFFIKSCVG